MTIALRPMSTSEILDRSFSLYRNNFALFAGIAALPAALKLVLDLVQLPSTAEALGQAGGFGITTRGSQANDQFVGPFLLLIVYLLGTVVATGATVYAVSMVYLGKSTSIGRSYGGIQGRMLRLIGMFLVLFIVLVVLGAVVIGIPAFAAVSSGSVLMFFLVLLLGSAGLVHLYVCYSVAPAACVIENTGVLGSLNRSQALTKGARGKIWLVFLLTFVLNLALGLAVLALVAAVVRSSHSNLAGALCLIGGQFVTSMLIAPILTVPLVLIYYDQRIRKEAFDLQLMMEALGENPNQAAAAPAG